VFGEVAEELEGRRGEVSGHVLHRIRFGGAATAVFLRHGWWKEIRRWKLVEW